MDQRTSDVEEDLKEILRTRLALAEKIQLLEQRVEETVHGTKTAALDAIQQARDTAVDFVETTTKAFDPRVQAGQRPWVLVGSAVAIGFLTGFLEHRRKSGVYPYYPPKTHGADVMPSHGNGQPHGGVYPFYTGSSEQNGQNGQNEQSAADRAFEVLKPMTSLWNELTEEFTKERDRIQQAALQTGKAFVHDVGRIMVQSLVDSLTRPGAARPDGARPVPRMNRMG
jgi:ElaB/YqjD/DUF883 family membrane-anchored ribosome-binding protein